MTKKGLHFYIIDDDEDLLQLYRMLLENAGHFVTTQNSSTHAAKEIIEQQPDCVLSDLCLPTVYGFDLFRSVRASVGIKQPIFIIITSKAYEYDSDYATEIGVDAYLLKPINPDTFVKEILDIMRTEMEVHFWGVRGLQR
jgi:DNA-binding response OmpR family regulator